MSDELTEKMADLSVKEKKPRKPRTKTDRPAATSQAFIKWVAAQNGLQIAKDAVLFVHKLDYRVREDVVTNAANTAKAAKKYRITLPMVTLESERLGKAPAAASE